MSFLINDIPMQIITATETINAVASLSPSRMQMVTKGTEIEDFNKRIVNEEIRTPENTDYFKGLINDELRTAENTLYLKGLMLEVLQEQGLI